MGVETCKTVRVAQAESAGGSERSLNIVCRRMLVDAGLRWAFSSALPGNHGQWHSCCHALDASPTLCKYLSRCILLQREVMLKNEGKHECPQSDVFCLRRRMLSPIDFGLETFAAVASLACTRTGTCSQLPPSKSCSAGTTLTAQGPLLVQPASCSGFSSRAIAAMVRSQS